MHLLDSMRKAKVDAAVISYSATISACEKGGQWQMAVHLFDSMRKAKVDANVISYSSTISACEKGGGVKGDASFRQHVQSQGDCQCLQLQFHHQRL